MGKKSPQLKVVGSAGRAQPYDIVSLSELGDGERDRINLALAEIEEGAGTLGVMRGERPWDLRPVVMLFGERGPSLLRFVGPEVAHAKSITATLKSHFKRQSSVEAHVLEWGTYQEQLWYRRPLFDRTLDAVLDSQKLPTVKEAFSIAEQLVKIVMQWHRAGVVHGHITSANVAVSIENNVSLFDAGIAYAIVEATRELGFEDFPKGYKRESFAPEILARGAVSYGTDVFGLGLVFEELFGKLVREAAGVEWGEITPADVQAVIEFARGMQAPEVHNRQQMQQVLSLIVNRGRPEPVAVETPAPQKPVSERHVNRPAPTRQPVEPEVKIQTPPIARANMGTASFLPGRVEMPAEPKHKEVEQVVAPRVAAEPVRQAPSLPRPGQARQGGLPRVSAADLGIAAKPAAKQAAPQVQLPPQIDLGNIGAALDLEASASNKIFGTESSYTKKPQQFSLKTVVALGIIAVVGVLYWNGTFESKSQEIALLTDADLSAAWESNLPSRMSQVAQAAIHKEFPSEVARTIILKSSQAGEEVHGLNAALLRVAFNQDWEAELTAEDRRTAFALATAALLKKGLPEDLPSLGTLHPGIIFAVTATSGSHVVKLLQTIPAAKLTELASPYRQAFKMLINEAPDATAGSPAVIELARFGAYGVHNSAQLVSFLENDSKNYPRLRALAYLFSQDPVRSRDLLNVLLGNPATANASGHALVAWGKDFNLYNWKELDSTDQLLLLAGVPIQSSISNQNIGKLLAHPVEAIRSLALTRLIDQGRLPHPGGIAAFTWARDHAAELDPKQTVSLAQIVVNFRAVKLATVTHLLSSNPPQELVQLLLLSTVDVRDELALDFELLRHLQNKGWKPSEVELKLLVKHPHRAVRLFAYAQVFNELEPDKAIVLLLDARKGETIPEHVEQLERNIAVLSKE